MIARPSIRHQHGLLRSASSCISPRTTTSPPSERLAIPFRSQPSQCQRRYAHYIPPLEHENAFRKNGVPGLYSPETFQMVWDEYMGHTLDRLNRIVAGKPYENDQLKDMAIKTARNPSTARDFNYASMAYNQHFYFDSLSPQTHSFPTDLAAHLSRSFSSLDTFKTTFLNTAAAMFGPGFVWLCLIRNPSEHHPNTDERRHPPSYKRDFETEAASRSAIDFRILPTYLAGSPFPGAHARQQSRDYNTTNIREVRAEAEAEHAAAQEGLTNTAGAFGRFAQNSISNPNAAIRTAAGLDNEPGMVSNVRFGGADVIPVLCVNVWEHAYVYDFGVGGKPGFLESWWERVDWEKVWRNCSAARESEVEEARSRSIGRRGTGGGRGRALLR